MQPQYRIKDSWRDVMESKRESVINVLFKKLSIYT